VNDQRPLGNPDRYNTLLSALHFLHDSFSHPAVERWRGDERRDFLALSVLPSLKDALAALPIEGAQNARLAESLVKASRSLFTHRSWSVARLEDGRVVLGHIVRLLTVRECASKKTVRRAIKLFLSLERFHRLPPVDALAWALPAPADRSALKAAIDRRNVHSAFVDLLAR